MGEWAGSTALLVVDVQQGYDDEVAWGGRNNPECEANVAKLIEEWRSHGWPVIFVRHDSQDPQSPLRAGQPGNEFKSVLTGTPDLVVRKQVYSPFVGDPNLHAWLYEHGITGIAICGIQTNLACENAARMASDLGYDVLFVLDAMHTFDVVAPNHQVYRAREISRFTALNLTGRFAKLVWTGELIDETRTERVSSVV